LICESLEGKASSRWQAAAWIAVCAALFGAAVTLYLLGDWFVWERDLAQIPARWLAGGLMLAGLVYLLLVPLIRWTASDRKSKATVLGLVIITGLAMRLIMIPAMPALEDDFYRYLWDGAVTASGHNPYALTPSAARLAGAPMTIQQLAADGAFVMDRVNHPHLKTIYPPVAQAAFAVAYWIEPWSLGAWRLVCLAGELATLALLFLLLGAMGRSPLWVALYWLNPLIVKELMNTAHMEAIVMPFVLGAIALVVLKRPLWATVSIGLAIGAKLWPVMLVPLVLRPLLTRPWHLVLALTLLGVMVLAWVLPPILGGLGSDSGFVAYAKHWQTNSALFQGSLKALRELIGALGVAPSPVGTALRIAAAVFVGLTALWLCRHWVDDAQIIVRRAAIIVLVLFLLSPAQFPWYASWVLVFAPLWPLAGLLAVTVFLPLYYVSFYFFAIQDFDTWYPWLVWVEWVPIWVLLAIDMRRTWRRPLDAKLGQPT